MKTEDLKRMLELVMAGHVASARDGEEDEGDMELRHLVCDYLEDVCRMALESLEPKGGALKDLLEKWRLFNYHVAVVGSEVFIVNGTAKDSLKMLNFEVELSNFLKDALAQAAAPQPSAREAALEEVAKKGTDI